MTPEGHTKKLIDTLLDKYDIQPASKAGTFENASGWYYKPGQSGFGVKGIPDYIGTYNGLFFGIEAKAPGKRPSGFQKLQIKAIACTGAAVFVVDGPDSLGVFEEWLKAQ